MDDRVAWAVITVPPAVMSGETADEWFSLSGRLGDGLEGSVNIVMSLTVSVRLFTPVLLLVTVRFVGTLRFLSLECTVFGFICVSV